MFVTFSLKILLKIRVFIFPHLLANIEQGISSNDDLEIDAAKPETLYDPQPH